MTPRDSFELRSCSAPQPQIRPRCFQCHRIESRCICRLVETIDNETDIVIVQHRRESRHPFGTAKLVEKGLQRCALRVMWRLDQLDVDFQFAPGAALLYPGEDAIPLESVASDAKPSQLVILDGTWHQAKALLRDQLQLRELPRRSLQPRHCSRYRIRREPAPHCISTVESVVEALRILEPGLVGLERLLSAFDTMIEWQVESQREPSARYLRRDANSGGRLPRVLRDSAQPTFLLYAESTAMQMRGERCHGREPFQICLCEAGSDDAAERFFLGLVPPSPQHLAHMRIEAEVLPTAYPLSTAAAWVSSKLPRGARIVAWNKSTLDLIAPLVSDHELISLKGAFCNMFGNPAGILEELVQRLSLPLRPMGAIHGRAAVRLAACEALFLALTAKGMGGLADSLIPRKARLAIEGARGYA